MKKITRIIFILFVMITLIGLQTTNAQEEVPIINEEQPSELAKDFNEKILPYIITFFVAFLGNASSSLIIKTIFNSSLKLLGLSKDKLEKANEVVGRSNLINEELKLLVTNKIDEAIKDISFYQQSIIEALDENKALKDEVKNFFEESNQNYRTIIDILKIAFLNNPDLVKSGYAIEIAKVIENEEK